MRLKSVARDPLASTTTASTPAPLPQKLVLYSCGLRCTERNSAYSKEDLPRTPLPISHPSPCRSNPLARTLTRPTPPLPIFMQVPTPSPKSFRDPAASGEVHLRSLLAQPGHYPVQRQRAKHRLKLAHLERERLSRDLHPHEVRRPCSQAKRETHECENRKKREGGGGTATTKT